MKNKLLAVVICALLLGSVGCKPKTTVKDEAELNEVEGVSMTIKEGTLTRTSATVVITDLSGIKNVYGQSFIIERKEDGIWKEVEKTGENYAFISMAYYVNENNQLEFKQDWSHIYGKLKNGEYRLVKDTFPDYKVPITESDISHFSVEFTIG